MHGASVPFILITFMNKKNLFLVGFVLLLAGLYAVYFTDWFQTRTILISATANRSVSTRLGAGRAAPDGSPHDRVFRPAQLPSPSTTTTNSPKSKSTRSPSCKPTNSPCPSGILSETPAPIPSIPSSTARTLKAWSRRSMACSRNRCSPASFIASFSPTERSKASTISTWAPRPPTRPRTNNRHPLDALSRGQVTRRINLRPGKMARRQMFF